jgi:hypothetical protein
MASNAMEVKPAAAPISYFYTTNNYIMDDKADLSMLGPGIGGSKPTSSTPIAPYEPKINM